VTNGRLYIFKQGVALTGCNSTGPPRSVSRPTAHAPGAGPPYPPAALQTTDDDDRRQQPLLACVGGPVINRDCSLCVTAERQK